MIRVNKRVATDLVILESQLEELVSSITMGIATEEEKSRYIKLYGDHVQLRKDYLQVDFKDIAIYYLRKLWRRCTR